MKYLFHGCSQLSSLPNIIKWNMSKVNNIDSMLYNCLSLVQLPDFSKWNDNYNINIDSIYDE